MFFKTANSDHEDSGTVFCFDIQACEVVWRIPGIHSGGLRVNLDVGFLEAGSPYGTGDPYVIRADLDGNVTNRNPASCYDIVSMGEKARSDGDIREAATLLHRALKTEISTNTKAQVCRSLGEMAEDSGNIEAALAHYQEALVYNPKVGVKRKVDAIIAKQGDQKS
ncbi:MAG TPA: hypothetical protein VJH03_04690 [Blastocatellia bacterium]|nr:hypothetical protein [Blastocatellia bacterium]